MDKWRTGPVALLGDAIHNMTPMAGIGANTALRDADLLRRNLIDAQRGAQSLTPAVADFEAQMLDYGFKAVKMSYRNAKRAASANRLSRYPAPEAQDGRITFEEPTTTRHFGGAPTRAPSSTIRLIPGGVSFYTSTCRSRDD